MFVKFPRSRQGIVGTGVGDPVGLGVGSVVGASVGALVGAGVGDPVGAFDVVTLPGPSP